MPPTIDDTLRALYISKGRLDPHDVLDVARDPRSPLHSRFEWDDTTAAEAYRVDQARTLIRSVKIERVIVDDEPPRMVRAWVHDPEADGYLATEDVAKRPDVRDRVLDDMRRDLERLQKKWELYRETFEQIAAEILLTTLKDGALVRDGSAARP